MQQKACVAVSIILAAIVIAAIYGMASFDISTLRGPGPLETSIANRARGWYVRRAAQNVSAPAVANDPSSISAGEGLYGMGCAACHGKDGLKPTPIGESMYPRVPNLSSATVQKIPDKELFWVIKNGIRLSGMPGFGNLDSDAEIWQMTYYVRSLGAPVKH